MKEFKLMIFVFVVSGLLLFCVESPVVASIVKPDLKVTSVSDVPASIALGKSFSVTDKVLNNGKKAAKAFTVRYYFSLDKIKSGNEILPNTRRVKSLKAKKYSTGTSIITVPINMPLNSYYLLACADDTNEIKESNEKNN